eukprot:5088182-Pyramimonas_sp.AAC.1
MVRCAPAATGRAPQPWRTRKRRGPEKSNAGKDRPEIHVKNNYRCASAGAPLSRPLASASSSPGQCLRKWWGTGRESRIYEASRA